MPHSELRPHFSKGLKWITSYLSTWRELLLRPFDFVTLADDERAKYTKPGDFAARTIALGGCLGYVVVWFIDDPLTPPAGIAISSTSIFYLNLAVFLVLWLFFGVFIARARRKPNSSAPLNKIFTALIYLVVGTATAFELLCALVLWSLSRLFVWDTSTVFLRDHFYFLITYLLLFYLIIFTPFFFTAWLVTRAIRRFYAVGRWRGIVIPAICWIFVFVVFAYILKTVNVNKLSTKEREALRTLYVLSDLESGNYCRDDAWEDDFAKLKNFVPSFHECGSEQTVLMLDVTLAKSYRQTNDGYRFTIQLHDSGQGCILRAHPIDYGGETKLSFAKRCTKYPMLETETVAQDNSGGDATRTGRFVIASTGWYLWDN